MAVRTTSSSSSKPHCFFTHAGGQCSDEYFSFQEIQSKSFEKRWFPKASSLLSVLFLRADLFYPSKVKLSSSHICSVHFGWLAKPHRTTTGKKCMACESFGKKSAKTPIYSNITDLQALVLHEKFDINNSYGHLICTTCRIHDLPPHFDHVNEEKHRKAFEWLNYLGTAHSYSGSESDVEEEFQPPPTFLGSGEEKKSVIKERKKLLNELLSKCGSDKTAWITLNYKSMEGQVKTNYLVRVRSIMKVVLLVLAPDESEDLFQAVVDTSQGKEKCVIDDKFLKVMSGIKEAYENADDAITRKEILSIVAPKVTFRTIQDIITGLTYYRFNDARLHAANLGVGVFTDPPSRISQRFSFDQVEHFIDFIVSPHVCTDVPFGENHLKLSDGTVLFVPNTIRNMAPSRIIHQYNTFCEENAPGFSPLKSSSLFKVLEVCKASYRKSLQGLNYFAADGGEAFDSLFTIVENLNLNTDLTKRLCDNLKRGRQYLKSDFKTHISKSSSIADHCATYALSDAKNSRCRQLCNHLHDAYCIDCETLSRTLNDIESHIKQQSEDKEVTERSLTIFRNCRDSINNWKCHLLRSVNQDWAREHHLSSLPDDGVFIYLDWAMKWLPMKYREPQSFFFGKRGISWHIAVVVKKNQVPSASRKGFSETEISSDEEDSKCSKPSFTQKVFVNVFDNCSQDSSAVLCTIEKLLREIHTSDPTITKAFIRSDNAGCYHCAETLLSLQYMAKKTGITVVRVDFSDPQGGKSPCDRCAAILKSFIRRYLNEKHDVTSASQFVDACRSYGGVTGVKASECRLILGSSTTVEFKFPGITNYNNFKFEKNGILAHRAWTVGPGQFFSFRELKFGETNNKLDCERQSGFIHQWSNKREVVSKTTTTVKSKEEKSNSKSSATLFECSEEGCIKKFFRYGNLVNHLTAGTHVREPEKVLLKDTAMQLYRSKLEQVGDQELISLMLETSNVENSLKSKENFESSLKEGWALPKERKNVRFSEKQTKFLSEKFDEGIQTSTRWKPEVLVSKMHELKVNGKFYFTVPEFLSASQVRSFFSREKAKRQKLIVREDHVIEEEECFKDDLALKEILDREALRQKYQRSVDADKQAENKSQLNKGVKHSASNQDISDKKRSPFRERRE